MIRARRTSGFVICLVAGLMAASAITAPAERTVDRLQREARGFYLLWAAGRPGEEDILKLPFIRGSQIVVQWGELETGPGNYDFSKVDAALARTAAANLWTTLQINGNVKPAWLFSEVPSSPVQFDEQVRNQEGTLMFWHPRFRQAHLEMLAAFAAHLRGRPEHGRLLGLRLNFNPIGTEHFNFPERYREPAAWTMPAGVDPATLAAFTPEVQEAYQHEVVNAYERHFADWTTVFVRNNLSDALRARYAAQFRAGRLAFFHTSAEVEPRAAGTERQYGAFYDFCRSGATVGYAEPWASAWGEHAGIIDPRWCSPAQWNYWTLLLNLHCGVSFIGEYYVNLHFAVTGRHGDTTVPGDSTGPREFMAAYTWGAEYAGLHNRPAESPGAWVAFRENIVAKADNPKVPPSRRKLNRFTGDYTWLAERLDGDGSSGVGPVGPPEQRFGAFARSYAPGTSARIRLDPRFLASLQGTSIVRVVALNPTPGVVRLAGDTFPLPASGASWRLSEFPVAAARLQATAAAQIEVRAGSEPLILHLVEVRRGANLP